MQLLTLLEHCGQLLSIIDKNTSPSDRLTSEYLRSKKYIGSKDRRFISETVFCTLRNFIFVKEIWKDLEETNAVSIKDFNFRNIDGRAKIFALYAVIQVVLISEFPDEYPYISIIPLLKKLDSSFVSISDSLLSGFASLDVNPETASNFIGSVVSCAERIFHDDNNSKEYLMKRYSMPEEFLKQLSSANSCLPAVVNDNFRDFVKEFNKPAPICIRVNSFRTTREIVVKHLETEGIECVLGGLSPDCIIIPKRVQLTELESYKAGEFEIQDEASQLTAFALNPNENDLVLDACAGAGGKSLHIANLQKNRGKIIASDVEFMRLKEINKRAERAGINSIEICMVKNDFSLMNINKKNTKPIPNLYDSVLIDAPCTGSGTIRREPLKKYRINSKLVKKINNKQYDILSNFSKYVKRGGTLVYSTCSIFPAENENILEKFLADNNNFVPEPLKPNFEKYNINIDNLSDKDFYLTCYPFLNKTDGFFISKLRRIE